MADNSIENSEEWRGFCADGAGLKVLYRPEYTPMTGSVTCGLLLAQIVYWFGHSKNGDLRAVLHDGDGVRYHCDTDKALGEQIGITRRQVKRSRGILADLGFIETRIGGFSSKKTVRYYLNWRKVLADLEMVRAEQLDRRPKREAVPDDF